MSKKLVITSADVTRANTSLIERTSGGYGLERSATRNSSPSTGGWVSKSMASKIGRDAKTGCFIVYEPNVKVDYDEERAEKAWKKVMGSHAVKEKI